LSFKTFGFVGSALLLFGGCPKRQTTPRIIYVPAPPAATEKSQPRSSQALVIEAPPPPQPAKQSQGQPAPAPGEETVREQHPVRRPARPPAEERPEEKAPVPTLEPSASPAQTAQLRREVTGLQSQLQGQIKRLNRTGLSRTELRTLGGARAFLAQSIRALQESDLQRALNLAHKAQLLVEAIQESQ
jgi:hypothetical protein